MWSHSKRLCSEPPQKGLIFVICFDYLRLFPRYTFKIYMAFPNRVPGSLYHLVRFDKANVRERRPQAWPWLPFRMFSPAGVVSKIPETRGLWPSAPPPRRPQSGTPMAVVTVVYPVTAFTASQIKIQENERLWTVLFSNHRQIHRKEKDRDWYIHLQYNALRTKTLKERLKTQRKNVKFFKLDKSNAVSIGTTAVKPYLYICPVGLVWFARYYGKMYSRHLFSYGGLQHLVRSYVILLCTSGHN